MQKSIPGPCLPPHPLQGLWHRGSSLPVPQHRAGACPPHPAWQQGKGRKQNEELLGHD